MGNPIEDTIRDFAVGRKKMKCKLCKENEVPDNKTLCDKCNAHVDYLDESGLF